MFATTPYITAREPRNDVSRIPARPLTLDFGFWHEPLSAAGKRQLLKSQIGRGGANLTMQRLIVALCLSAAAALVPNSAAARSSNAKAPLKVVCRRP